MLTLSILILMLTVGIAVFAALGVEDDRFHKNYVPARFQVSPTVTPTSWEQSLPGRKKLPWSETAGEWVAAGK